MTEVLYVARSYRKINEKKLFEIFYWWNIYSKNDNKTSTFFLSITHNLNKTVHKSIVQGTITDEADNKAIPKYLQLCDNERIAH